MKPKYLPLKSKLSAISKRSRKPRGNPHAKLLKKVSATVRANSSTKSGTRRNAAVIENGRPRLRKSTSPPSASTALPEICVTDWPEDPKELRRLITVPVHPEADRLHLWPREKLVATAQVLQAAGKPIDPVQRLRETGEIIDGRNTWLVSLMAGIKPLFVDIVLPEDMTAAEYVEFRNVVRRQLSFDELALFAAKRYIVLREEGIKRRGKNLRKGIRAPEVEQIPFRQNNLTFLSNLFSVNVRYIQDATTILEQAPELFANVESGKVKFSDARAQMQLVQHRSCRRDIDRSAPVASANGNQTHKMDCPVTPQGIDYPLTLEKLLKAILRLRSTPKAKREIALERLIREASEIQTRRQLSGKQDSVAATH